MKSLAYMGLNFYPSDEFLCGEGLFETILLVNGVPVFLEEHFERLRKSSLMLGYPFPFTLQETKEKILELHAVEKSGIRMTYRLPQFFLQALPAAIRPKEWSLLPVCVPPHPLAGHKVTDRKMLEEHRMRASGAGATDALLVAPSGEVLETTRANFFSVRKGSISTHPCDGKILPGIVRSWVIRTSQLLKIPIFERAIGCEELHEADEIFVTNSLIGIVPVSEIAGVWRSESSEGETTKKLRDCYLGEIFR